MFLLNLSQLTITRENIFILHCAAEFLIGKIYWNSASRYRVDRVIFACKISLNINC